MFLLCSSAEPAKRIAHILSNHLIYYTTLIVLSVKKLSTGGNHLPPLSRGGVGNQFVLNFRRKNSWRFLFYHKCVSAIRTSNPFRERGLKPCTCPIRMPPAGLEPARVSPHGSKPCAFAYFATEAFVRDFTMGASQLIYRIKK